MVSDYLSHAGPPLAGVRAAVRHDHELAELLTTPLMLSVATLAYAGVPADAIGATGNPEQRRRRLFTDYVHAMLGRPRAALAPPRFQCTTDQVHSWLSWLARAMTAHHQSVFYPDRLQLSWLPTRTQRVRAVVAPMVLAGLTAMVADLVFALISGDRSGLSYLYGDDFWSWYFMLWWLGFHLVVAMSAYGRRITPASPYRGRALFLAVVRLVLGGCAGGLTAWRLMMVQVGEDLAEHLANVPGAPLVLTGLAGGLAAAAGTAPWWRMLPARRAFRAGVAPGLAAGSAVLFAHQIGLPRYLSLVVLVAAAGLAVVQLRPVPDLTPAVPGAAIRRTRDQAVIISLVVTTLTFSTWFLGFQLPGYQQGITQLWPPFDALATPMFLLAAVAALRLGLADYLRHQAVCALLRRDDALPRDLLGFLDFADSHVLLRRAGGGYLFVHRLLLDYFAEYPVTPTSPQQETTATRPRFGHQH
jgi:hypothetical protein